MHECPFCGQACNCDGEDTWLNPPDHCQCECLDEYDEENDEEWNDWASDDIGGEG